MGTESTLEGDFVITPHLSAAEIRRFPDPANGKKFRMGPEFQLEVERDEQETEDGINIKLYSFILKPAYREGKHYYTLSQLEDIARTYGKDHAFDGYVEKRVDNDEHELVRYYIRGTKVIEVKPTITWEEPK